MPKKPLSVTLETDNLLWLRGQVATSGGRSLSDALDALITAARTNGRGAAASRSVVGTIDIALEDPALDTADAYVREKFEASLARPFLARETKPSAGSRRGTTSARRG